MRKLVLVTGIFLLLFLLNLNVSSKSDEALKIGMMTDITTLYPWGEISLETNSVLGTIYETLIRLSKTGTDLEPCLAEKYEPSADFKTWTFHLRKNVRFHDGSILNADAVVASLSLHRVFENKIKKIDDATVLFTLDKANVYFPVTLTAGYFAIASLATIKCYKANCKPVVIHGTGPFIFQQWNPNKEIVLSANQNYWGTKPLVKDVIFVPFQSDNELVQALKNQTIHLSLSVSPGSIEAIRELPQITFRSIPTLSIGFLSMNTTKAPFRTIKVRQAISYAINKNELIKKYFFGGKTGLAARTFLPSPMFESSAKSIEEEYNPGKAKTLLREAGFPDGFETTLMPPAVRRPYFPNPVQIAEDIKKNLAEINIKVQIVHAKSWQDFLNHMHDGTFDMMLYGWMADTTDPSDMLTSLLTTSSINAFNSARWSNKKFDGLIEMTRSQKDLTVRNQLYHEAEIEFQKEMPFVPLFNPLQIIAWNEKVKGFIPHPVNKLYLQYLSWGENK